MLQLAEEKYPHLKVHAFGRAYFYRQYSKKLIGDAMMSMVGTVVIWTCMTFYLGSFTLTSFAMLNVPLAVPLVLVGYRLGVSVSNLTAFNMLLIFVVMGFLADNTYLIWDAW